MRILVLGATGMLGHKILLKFRHRFEVMGTLRKPNDRLSALLKGDETLLHTGIDAFHPEKTKALLNSFKPDVVINCIGIVKQLKEAKDPYISITVNALFPHQLEQLGNEHGFRLIHLSTDCVFSGKKGPYRETDPMDVNDLYGQTKYLGEVKGSNALTLRTSIIGREVSTPYTGLIEWFLAQEKTKERVKGYTNALYTGLTTNCLTDVLEDIIINHKDIHGLYHLATDEISKFDLLNLVKQQTGMDVEIMRFAEFKCDRRLDASAYQKATGWKPPKWKAMIEHMFEEDSKLYAI